MVKRRLLVGCVCSHATRGAGVPFPQVYIRARECYPPLPSYCSDVLRAVEK